MPSAQHVQIDEHREATVDGDLRLLLDENHTSTIPKFNLLHNRGHVLFAEGESARGIHILRTGRASVSISSSEGRVVILRMAQPGDVLGLSSVLRNAAYDTTVKALDSCRTDFISRAELLNVIQKSKAGADAVLKILSHELIQLTERTRSLLLPQTTCARLAKLLLEYGNESQRIDRVFTHEEIAQMICSSRETVTRLLATLSRRKIIQITADSVFIRDRLALESLV
ncbi:MAG TPA: Crp/Fnr family transcriptional regulator [Pyrinomonadaceae bacterium]|nr:Crp/Fnr family transcriptional regulator [Pyrinomonadaceae bacterium]